MVRRLRNIATKIECMRLYSFMRTCRAVGRCRAQMSENILCLDPVQSEVLMVATKRRCIREAEAALTPPEFGAVQSHADERHNFQSIWSS